MSFPRPLLSLLLLAPTLARAADWAPNLTTTAIWQDNVTNADRRSDIVGALALTADLSAARRFSLATNDTLLLTARVAGESFPRFAGLNRLTLGPSLAISRKFGLGPTAPVLSFSAAADIIAARERDRGGLVGTATLAFRQRFGEATQVVATQEFSRLDARGAVHDRSAVATSVELTRTLSADWQFGAVARFRSGDVLAYGTPPRPDLVAIARIRSPADTFGPPMVAYSFRAHTLAGGFSLTRLLGERTAFTFAAEYRSTAKSSLRYVNRLVSGTLAHQF